MIAPRDFSEIDAVERVSQLFALGGLLSRAKNYESRRPQQQMAEAITRALYQKKHLLVEAGTGVGKSLAYLVPSLIQSLEQGQKAVISTHTIHLQEQLIQKDIPLLSRLWPEPFESVLLKGRQNYLCPRRLDRALRYSDGLLISSEHAELRRIHQWYQRTTDGSLSDLDPLPDPKVWQHVCSDPYACTPRICGTSGHCPYHRSRQQAQNAHLIIINHSLFFTTLSLLLDENHQDSDGADGYLFPNDFVIFDEAHTLENIAARHLGWHTSRYALRHHLQRLYHPRTQKGLLTLLRSARAVQATQNVFRQVDEFFDTLHRALPFQRGTEVRLREPDIIDDSLNLPLAHLYELLRDEGEACSDEDLREELSDTAARIFSIRNEITQFLQQSRDDYIYWAEQSSSRGQDELSLHAAPLEVAPLLSRLLFKPNQSVIMTSATLSLGRDQLRYFQNRIGGHVAHTEQFDSPFNFARQMRVYVPRHIPLPTQPEAYEDALDHWIRHFTQMTRGSAFVLFTSYKLMLALAVRLQPYFRDQSLPLLVQDGSVPRQKMIQEFKRAQNAVLFGVDSFWQGVDVAGEALSNVIITRLPFPVPDNPLVQARCEQIEASGGDAFRDYTLPEAILKFRQGIGRLIRTAHDSGIVAILDPRILSKSYGRHFFAALPECPVEILDDSGSSE